MKRLAITLSLLLASSVFSQVAQVYWLDQPTGFVASHYLVRIGTNAGAYDRVFSITNSLSFSNIYAPGNYFVTVSAVDTNGLESGQSQEIKFTIFPTLKVRVSIQSKKNLSDPWLDRTNMVEMVSTPGDQFFRTKLDIIR